MNRFGLFDVESIGFAIPLVQIEKILQGAKLHQLPRLPGAVVAVLVVGEQLVPLLDAGPLLGGDSQPLHSHGYQILVDSEYGMVALMADSGGRIVSEQKGRLVPLSSREKMTGVTGQYIYQDKVYKVLDINYLAIEMTQVYWQNQPDTGGARRHQ
jgi:chemotaxis signal transduction protein